MSPQTREAVERAVLNDRNEQASKILGMLDDLLPINSDSTITIARDTSSGLTVVRHSGYGSFRGITARDAFAQLTQRADLAPETERSK
jgi:hypothetical protein